MPSYSEEVVCCKRGRVQAQQKLHSEKGEVPGESPQVFSIRKVSTSALPLINAIKKGTTINAGNK